MYFVRKKKFSILSNKNVFARKISLLRAVAVLNLTKCVETDNPIFIKMDLVSNWSGLRASAKDKTPYMIINLKNVLAKLASKN